MPTPLLERVEDWRCPNCGRTEQTKGLPANAQRFHPCPRLKGLTAPMVRAHIKVKVEVVERGDWVGSELVQTAPEDGRPYLGVQTTRDDGTDMAVFAATATASLRR